MDEQAIKIRVFGVVQGVGYRYFTQRQAMRLGLKGRVRNVRNGSVEIHAQGSADAVQSLLHYCQQGPVGAQVQRVQSEKTAIQPNLVRFVIAH